MKKWKYFLAILLFISSITVAAVPHQAAASTKYTYYVHSTTSLYNSTKSSKKKLAILAINVKLTTYSSKSSTMYKVAYAGRTGYVYKSKLSTKATAITRYVSKSAGFYTNTTSKKQKIGAIPVGTKLYTYSPLSNTMYKVYFNGKAGYVYQSNLSPYKYTFKFGETAWIGDLEVKVEAPVNNNPLYAYGDDYTGVKNVVEFRVTVKNVGKKVHDVYSSDFSLFANNILQDRYYGYKDAPISGTIYPGKTVIGNLYYATAAQSNLSLYFDSYQYDSNYTPLKPINFIGKN